MELNISIGNSLHNALSITKDESLATKFQATVNETDGKSFTVNNLTQNIYTVNECIAVDGYEKANPITIEVQSSLLTNGTMI